MRCCEAALVNSFPPASVQAALQVEFENVTEVRDIKNASTGGASEPDSRLVATAHVQLSAEMRKKREVSLVTAAIISSGKKKNKKKKTNVSDSECC